MAPPAGRHWERTPRRGGLPWPVLAVPAAVLLVAVLVVAGGRLAGLAGGGRLSVEPEDPPAAATAGRGTARAAGDDDRAVTGGTAAVTWIGVPDPPIAWVRPPRMVWTGRVVLAWGAAPDGPAGAAFDPASRTWRVLPPAPIGAREGHVAVWAGSGGAGEMIVWGGRPVFDSPDEATAGAAYDPAANRWRLVADAPITARRGAHATWTGTHVVVAAGPGGSGSGEPAAAAYDPGEDTWLPLPAVAAGTWLDGLTWTGGELVALLGQPGRPRLAPVATWDAAAGVWTPHPPAPVGSASRPIALATAPDPVLWVRRLDGTGRLLLLDGGTGRWVPTPPAPLTDRVAPLLAWTGRHVVVWSGADAGGRLADGALYDMARGRWLRVDPGPRAVPRPLAAVWTGSELIVVGYRERDRHGVVASSWAPLVQEARR